MADEPIGAINLGNKEISPEEQSEYMARIRAAKAASPLGSLKGKEVIGGVARPSMPLLQRRAAEGAATAPQEGVVPRGPGAPVLRPETAQQLEAAVKAGQEQTKVEEEKKEVDAKKAEEEARLARLFEEFDFGDNRGQVDKILDNKKRRQEIESRCKEMDFEDLLMKDEVEQRVPIIPGKFEPKFRSLTPIETTYLAQRMSKETVQTDRYLGEKYNLLLLCCSLVDINGTPFPDHRKITREGFELDDKLFEEKLRVIMRKSAYIIADLGVNYMWFDIRVRKLLNPDAAKNG